MSRLSKNVQLFLLGLDIVFQMRVNDLYKFDIKVLNYCSYTLYLYTLNNVLR